MLTLREPRRIGPRAVLGSAAAAAGFTLSAGLGLALGALHGDRQLGANTAGALACDAALGLAGVSLDVSGEQHLWSSRPAVFIANHQSALDPIVVGALLRRDITGVAKKELRRNPAFLLAGLAINVTYIDRSNSAQARAELDKLVDRIRGGISVVIFPEGVRTTTPVLAPFKKGAFHLAMQAGVPIVPIVLRNTGELWWRDSPVVHPGTVQVRVLEPIPTHDWAVDDLTARVAGVRDRFADTLERWPD